MSSVNKAIIVGNVGNDPEVRYTSNGAAIANFSIATSRTWKDKTSGERQEETEWHRVVAFDRTAEIVGQYVAKGGKVYVEGRLKTRRWEDKEGITRYTTEIMVDNLVLLGGRDDDGGRQQSRGGQQQGRGGGGGGGGGGGRAPAPAPRPQQRTNTGFDDMDDDIPF
ncbi:Ssb Single-stranded DNA-binding protein [uncultured Caudovirales phage]|uniref:Ssb Single-stranded DNA-binding protein n=1 Tax=uncultured Caudovirales phage TaxID=2100421 RepID=A0A6J5NK81_9CAUD|nr:Ssb Single-stranded DNA-binding protein [uncultured Caudovirales phage]